MPVDYASAGQIRDDSLYDNLVCALPEGSHMMSLMDCCHSGTVLDLPYKYRSDGSTNTLDLGGLFGGNGGGKVTAGLIICMVIIFAVIFFPLFFSSS